MIGLQYTIPTSKVESNYYIDYLTSLSITRLFEVRCFVTWGDSLGGWRGGSQYTDRGIGPIGSRGAAGGVAVCSSKDIKYVVDHMGGLLCVSE